MFFKTLTCVIALTFTATFFLALTSISDAKIDYQNVAGMWLFDEGSGDTAKDSSANGNDGEITKAKWVDGRFGKALNFDGKSSCVLVPDSESLSMIGNITLVAWVNPSNLSGISPALIRKGPKGASGITWFWYLRSGNQICFFTSSGERGFTFNPAVETWYHLATTVDDSGNVTPYVNGEEQKIDFTSGGTPAWADDNEPLNIGEWDTHDFAGIIDEIGIFNVVLTGDDIKSMMTNGLRLSAGAAVSPSDKLAATWAYLKIR